MNKVCNVCDIEKPINEFYFRNDVNKYRNECKECYRKKKRKFYHTKEERLNIEKNKEKEKLKHKNKKKCSKCGEWKDTTEFYKKIEGKVRACCKKCISEHSKRKEFKNKRNKIAKKRREENLEFYRKKERCYRNNNKEEVKERANRWKKENPEKIRFYRRKLERKKLKEVPVFRLKKNISRSLLQYLKEKKGGRTTEKLISETFLSIKLHLEEQFGKDMNWNNYGSYWHIDHIIPQSLYNFTDDNEIKKCWNKRNLRPLRKEENLLKSGKLDFELVEEYEIQKLLPNNF